MNLKKKSPPPGKKSRKRPYRSPALTTHGTLKDMTRTTTKAGAAQDGGKPSTRSAGPPG
jgi:hypothetical protein